jgi:hypothetical protein
VVNTGATDVRGLADGDDLFKLLLDYNNALITLFYMVVATSGVTIFGSVLVEWRSMKKAGQQAKPIANPVGQEAENEKEEA